MYSKNTLYKRILKINNSKKYMTDIENFSVNDPIHCLTFQLQWLRIVMDLMLIRICVKVMLFKCKIMYFRIEHFIA